MSRPGPIQTGPLPRGTETLLVVEDEPSVRHLARGVLDSLGYEVLSASNGQDALHVAREHKGSPIRLVITDVIMPLMGGKVMAEWLKTTYPDLKILFTSGYTDDAIAHHGVLETGVEFLPKPYTPATLARKVRQITRREKAKSASVKIKTKILWTLLGMSLLVALVGCVAVNRLQAAATVSVTNEAQDVARLVGLLAHVGLEQTSPRPPRKLSPSCIRLRDGTWSCWIPIRLSLLIHFHHGSASL